MRKWFLSNKKNIIEFGMAHDDNEINYKLY